MKAMYPTVHPSTDTSALGDTSFLFSSHHGDLLSMSSPEPSPHLKPRVPEQAPISGFSNGLNGHYENSTPSSHYGDSNDLSEPGGGFTIGRDDRDTSMSSGNLRVNHDEPGHAPSRFAQVLLEGNRGSLSSTTPSRVDSLLPVKPIQNDGLAATTPNGQVRKGINASPPKRVSPRQMAPESAVNSTHDPTSSSLSEPPGSPEPPNRRPISQSSIKTTNNEFRARSSIPSSVAPEEFARQSILAADSSRLNPFALHPGEYKILRDRITPTQVTIYLNIRNAILRLWTKNPLVTVTLEEAAGCAREPRYFGMAKVAYHWLMRNGYINFGCLELPTVAESPRSKAKAASKRTVLVIGAGMSGLGCARQLEGLFTQLGNNWRDVGERPPKVVVLEARKRVGGRVYSHHLRNQAGSSLPAGHRCTAEMGAQIVTGFEHGNPMNAIIRGQLGIPYHGLRDNTILYDHDGSMVDRKQDTLVEKLYNDILERASVYRTKPASFRTVEGDRHLMLFGLDPSDTGGPLISTLEESTAPFLVNGNGAPSKTEEKPTSGVEKLAGRAYQLTAGFNPDISAAEAAVSMGYELKPGVSPKQSLNLDTIAKTSDHPTLGETMDDGIKQYQNIANLTPKDLRLLNWHHANLEYANAASVNQLSLSGWDQDIGNEFEGEHSEIIGGYQQVPRGLWKCPKPLDIRFNSVIKSIRYDPTEKGNSKAVRVVCTNGDVFEADKVVLTTPLGVLKDKSIEFDPPLPGWKQDVIERMGFGLLNKVVLVYEKPFWETHRDMFGMLNEAEREASLDQKDYAARRGRFYLFWNCIKTSGRPVLVALMAGNAAHDTEESTDASLIYEVTDQLTKMFAPGKVPQPIETIVTRWKKDPFARGSYSFVGPRTQIGDYNVMARSHGPLYFAGEATCGSHPATVHGAYLSGLRAAAEVVESFVGPIQVPSPLVEKKVKPDRPAPISAEAKRKLQSDAAREKQPTPRQARDEDYEAGIIGAILTEIGERPIKPSRGGVNPFLLYTKDFWHPCKAECDEKRRAATGDPTAKASKTEIRTALGAMWRNASAEVKKPYLDQTQHAKEQAAALLAEYNERVVAWDRDAKRIREEYIQNHPPQGEGEELLTSRAAIEHGSGKRQRRL